MKKILFPIFIAFIALLFHNCEPEFDIYAENRDITVAYALLDVRDSIHYVKVYKGFQSTGNPLEDAQNMENLYYFDKITVTLEEYINKELVRSVVLDTTTSIPREEGVFAAPQQLLYVNTEPFVLDGTATYKLKIVNKETGKVTEGETKIVNDFAIRYPYEMAPMNLTAKEAEIQFDAAVNAKAYQVYFKFHYLEKKKATGEITRKTLVRDLTSSGYVYAGNTQSGKYAKKFSPQDFYKHLLNELEVDESVVRYKDGLKSIEVEVWAGANDYVKYLEVNKPSSSLVQDRLEYTNLTCPTDEDYVTSYGVFSSRTMKERFYDMTNLSEDTLVMDTRMKPLGFDYYRNL